MPRFNRKFGSEGSRAELDGIRSEIKSVAKTSRESDLFCYTKYLCTTYMSYSVFETENFMLDSLKMYIIDFHNIKLEAFQRQKIDCL